ncbi:glutathione S-transferase N-terminal domain-containing protein [Dyella caseinilytica]|uniref:Glutathione S-transferase N-terminal domain-containing protein n=1 Tax=Dyella caseinilytica TaxID=1849581 RepID=A0ABX7GR18_9GAMM|nr:glutathione S-transferase N-terminal domain-containing protein [Dyella caseinilytica]QRN52374.1 glutathione S-transferase N-terminal domain-containing protein [Dyella caseinilytica]GGA05385.1 glutathione S-transferase [Dyella caseinilytica]
MKLYYLPGACSMADHIVLEWIGKPYQAEAVAREALRSPEYLKISPHGMVPALVDDDGWTLTENVAILNYLMDRFPEAKLDGESSPRERAEVNRWLAFLNSDLHPAFKPLFGAQRFSADETHHPSLHEAARQRLRGLFERVNTQLADREWLTGHRSVADAYLFVVLRWAKGKQVDLQGLDHLDAFSKRLHADPGVKAAMQAEGI